MKKLPNLTHENASIVIRTLKEQGVEHFCLAPGSRSTPLMLAISKLQKKQVHVHFDERGLGFLALGLAKASKKPVAILVTSGTAVANLLPSIIEASLSHTPLILLSADRPPELRDCGSNQTIDQVKIFSPFLKWEIDLPLSDPFCESRYIASRISYGVKKGEKGPIQINCMIREPFFPLDSKETVFSSSCSYAPSSLLPDLSSLQKWSQLLSKKKKGIILLGLDAFKALPPYLLAFAKKIGWPILCDILSQGRALGEHPCHAEHFELFIRAFPSLEIDAILHIGDRFVSKELLSFIQKQKDLTYFHVTENDIRYDPLSLINHKMECNPSLFLKAITPFIKENTSPSWISFWQNGSSLIKKNLEAFFAKEQAFSEPSILYSLKEMSHFFFSNSMPIRDADLFLYPKKGISFSLANRGASGIDGNIATAAGASYALEKPLVAVLGDLASLHDLNSLALIKKAPSPIFLVIINNGGGGIFSFLPVAGEKECFEELVATSHCYDFSLIAKSFLCPYYFSETKEGLKKALEQARKDNVSCLIECKSSREENKKNHNAIYQEIQDTLCSSTDLLETLKNHSSSFSTVS
jgi:2-succinyl-5-enolpyruvyl-6-hydroxy-3-cyclohexene-1-carboxylate synthase